MTWFFLDWFLILRNAFQGEFYNEFGHKVSATVLKDVVNLRKILMMPKNFGEVEMQIVNALAVLDFIYVEHNAQKIILKKWTLNK